MAIEILDLPIKKWRFFHSYVNVYQRVILEILSRKWNLCKSSHWIHRIRWMEGRRPPGLQMIIASHTLWQINSSTLKIA